MQPTDILYFGEFQLDLSEDRVWHGRQELKLTAKAFAVLHYLAAHPQRVVSKTELFAAVWPGIVVSDWALATCVREIRRVLGDMAKTPQLIETVYRRGYRFLPTVTTQPVRSSESGVRSQDFNLAPNPQHPAPVLVGREAELVHLHSLFGKAANGERQIVFVTGEPGIGKTTLVEAFAHSLASSVQGLVSQEQEKRQRATGNGQKATIEDQPPAPNPQHPTPVFVARGQCIEQYGTGEAYLPVLEALARLGRAEARAALKAVLEQYAPTWLLHLPALLTREEATALQPRVLGATRERMLREFTEAVEVLTNEPPLVLVLEDLHWADVSTLELLAAFARRRETARVLILGTYRPAEAGRNSQVLRSVVHELHTHETCVELALPQLREEDVEIYLQQRFPHTVFPTRLAKVLYRATEGNPLFVVRVLNDLIARGVTGQGIESGKGQDYVHRLTTGVPESIRHLVARQREQLTPEERQVLEAASVAGLEFSAAEVAAALAMTAAEVEENCARLAEHQRFLRPAGISAWPDHTLAARYGFLHSLYQELWHEQVSVSRRQEWHQRIGERKEAAYGERASEIAAELAVHFEQGRQYDKVLYYLHQAAGTALRRSANPEAIHHLQRALELLTFLPDTLERARHELDLQVALGAPLMMTKGYTSLEVKKAYDRAWELCQEVGQTEQLFPVLVGLSRFYYGRNSSRRAIELREQQLKLAHSGQDPSLTLVAHMNLSGNLFFQGDFAQALSHAEQGLGLYDPQQHRTLIFLHGDDPEVTCGCWAALWYLGYRDQALARISRTLRSAQDLAHPFGLAFALFWSAFLHQAHGKAQQVREQTDTLLTLTQKHGIPQFGAMGEIMRGWALTQQGHSEEGLTQLQRGLASLQATRQGLGRPYFLALLAEAYHAGERVDERIQIVDEALDTAGKSGECMHQAELHRLKGVLALQAGVRSPESEVKNSSEFRSQGPKSSKTESLSLDPQSQSEAEACFLKAIEIACMQGAKSLELRAAMSLSWLWQQQGRKKEAHKLLWEIYGWFTEGFGTADLKKARALLDSLASDG